MNEELKQFAELIIKSMESMEERMDRRFDKIDQRLDAIEADIKIMKTDIRVIMESTEKTAIEVSSINSKIAQHEDRLTTLAFAHLKLVK